MKRALISVYDKDGIVEFAQELSDLGWQIISTGGTYQILKESGLEVITVEEVTGYPEILNGRVKTLHPAIYGGILARSKQKNDLDQINEMGINKIDLVVCNLYPFEELLDEGAGESDLIENIDIGGPTMLRAAAKNFSDTLVVCDKSDYNDIINRLKEETVDLSIRRKYSAKAFRLTAYYDAIISNYFTEEKFPEKITTAYSYSEKLRYGENPHQEAVYYKNAYSDDYTLQQLHGKQISYNNYNDLKAAMDLVKEFKKPAVVAVKHLKPCGVGVGDSLTEAYQKAYEGDDTSIYGGIIALNREVDKETAELMNKIFLEVIIAPSFSKGALEILTQKKNIRLISVVDFEKSGVQITKKQTYGGLLVQDRDNLIYEKWENMTSRPLLDTEKDDLQFAWRVVKHVESNGMVIAKDGQTLAIGNGEVRRVWALENALKRAAKSLDGAVVASDGFFFADTIELLSDYGIKAVVSPGGSIKDQEVIKKAEENGISLIFTGTRHFKH